MGVFCALVGALMLIAPQQFAVPTVAPLRPWVIAWGAGFFVAGVSLVISAVGVRGPLMVGSCLGAALALFVLAFSFLLTGGWTGVAVYAIFGLATLLSPPFDRSSGPGEEGIHLFVLAASLAGIANGIVLVLLPGRPLGPPLDLIWSPLAWNALLFLVGGGGVLVTRLRGRASPFLRGVTQAALGVRSEGPGIVPGRVPIRHSILAAARVRRACDLVDGGRRV